MAEWNQCPDCSEQENVILRESTEESGYGDDDYFACGECGTTWRDSPVANLEKPALSGGQRVPNPERDCPNCGYWTTAGERIVKEEITERYIRRDHWCPECEAWIGATVTWL